MTPFYKADYSKSNNLKFSLWVNKSGITLKYYLMENPQQGLKECSQVVDSLTEKFDRIAIADGLALLLKLLGNIAKHPGDVKYRKIKTTNKTLASRVFSLRGIESILTALGFSLQGEFYVYNAQPVQHI